RPGPWRRPGGLVSDRGCEWLDRRAAADEVRPAGGRPACRPGARGGGGAAGWCPTGGASGWTGVPPQTRHARLGSDRLAYQVLGQGPPDLVFTMGAFSNIDVVWDDPQMALFLRRLAGFSRLIRFDRRAPGASDPLPASPLPPWEAYTQELSAVMDTVGSQQAALLAAGPEAGPMALVFAGTKPERTAALILADATARYLVADDYRIGVEPEAVEAMIARAQELWGTEAFAETYAPSRADDQRFLRWSARLERAIASPKVVRASLRVLLEVYARSLLQLRHAPYL